MTTTIVLVDDFIDTVSMEIIQGKNRKASAWGDQRMGQWWFNRLSDYRPDIANQIAGSLDDPFNQDAKINQFLLKVIELW